jgi:hypothetical protein
VTQVAVEQKPAEAAEARNKKLRQEAEYTMGWFVDSLEKKVNPAPLVDWWMDGVDRGWCGATCIDSRAN